MAFDSTGQTVTRQLFKTMAYQTAAVQAVVECFKGQPFEENFRYRVDPGQRAEAGLYDETAGFRNAELVIGAPKLLDNIQTVQNRAALVPDRALVGSQAAPLNLDIEMETGTGKTYCYIKTMFELNAAYGWSKFIIIVPSIAIREGVAKTFEDTADHFMQTYGKRARAFIYNSAHPHNIEQFSSDAGLNVMIINIQAFAATGKDQRRIYMALDSFQSRRPIDVISANRPILILDEPQKMEGPKAQEAMKHFRALFCMRYSATHRTQHNLIHRLDAIDAYNQKLVKKIAVRGIAMQNHTGANAYLYLHRVESGPRAYVDMEMRIGGTIKRKYVWLKAGDNLHDKSGGLEQYLNWIVADIDVLAGRIDFTAHEPLFAGQAQGDVNEADLRRIQIRETIKAHLDKERALYPRGIKVLSLFFIDSVAKYREYDAAGEAVPGEYARIFEEEYAKALEDLDLFDHDTPWKAYIERDGASAIHNGYFSIDKKKRMVDPTVSGRGEDKGESRDSDAYDLILKNKGRLLSLDEPVRFIFSHSALREGWDNPNVFTICTLKHSDNTITRRQEVGRGLRISVNSNGVRMDHEADVHQINVLTVVANESYENFVKGFQGELAESLSSRPRQAKPDFFKDRKMVTENGTVTVTEPMAFEIYAYLLSNQYCDAQGTITENYHADRIEGNLKPLPLTLTPYTGQVFALVDSVFSDAKTPLIEDDRKRGRNELNRKNFQKAEFQALWSKINQKAVYQVAFDTDILIRTAREALNAKLQVPVLSYAVKTGEQIETQKVDAVRQGRGFKDGARSDFTYDVSPSSVAYDLVGKIAAATSLTRRTVGEILQGLNPDKFAQFKENPEAFIAKASEYILLEKARLVIEHLRYDRIADRYTVSIFEMAAQQQDLSKAQEVARHVFKYLVTDSQIERDFARALETSEKVVVYAKLPSGFTIPTPVGGYNPDWAIAFEVGSVKHVYFVAETKGSLNEESLRETERARIDAAKAFFRAFEDKGIAYGVVATYEDLLKAVS